MNTVMAMLTPPSTAASHSSMKVGAGLPDSGQFAQLLGSQFAPDAMLMTEPETPSFDVMNWLQSLVEQDIEIDQDELLRDETIQTLLSFLPESWQEELAEWLNLNESLEMAVHINETLIEDMPGWSDEQLIVAGLIISQIIENEAVLRSSPILSKEVNNVLVQLFPMLRIDQQMDRMDLKIERIVGQLQRLVEEMTQISKGTLRGMNLPVKQDSTNEPLFINALQKLMNEKEDTTSSFIRSGVNKQPNQGLMLPQFGLDAGQMMTRTQQAVIHIGEQLPREVQQEQLLKQFQQLMQRGVFKANEAGMNHFSVKLFPAHLGRLDIQLTQIEGVLVARLLTSSATAKELVESQLQHLRQAFINQQLNVERVEVVNQHQTSVKDDQQSNKDQTRDDREKNETESEDENDSFQVFLEELTINEKV
ncbi:flagellar hook-length control protein FliK [Alkalihalophilus lindianensis]|uniref:Flagellar hook-length control protein FliK n=1 Tax=Alkalihalophilus lindianensis TaxID=1630542 RepID=A0ABU3XC17_9BACI|nr:flagellar hook-length control protein FliK [Alkalihalophilus lindianensis]MDV2685432.1 flagellar hook-length control protein FliK [Alkalihalophilus lindianensis]